MDIKSLGGKEKEAAFGGGRKWPKREGRLVDYILFFFKHVFSIGFAGCFLCWSSCRIFSYRWCSLRCAPSCQSLDGPKGPGPQEQPKAKRNKKPKRSVCGGLVFIKGMPLLEVQKEPRSINKPTTSNNCSLSSRPEKTLNSTSTMDLLASKQILLKIFFAPEACIYVIRQPWQPKQKHFFLKQRRPHKLPNVSSQRTAVPNDRSRTSLPWGTRFGPFHEVQLLRIHQLLGISQPCHGG